MIGLGRTFLDDLFLCQVGHWGLTKWTQCLSYHIIALLCFSRWHKNGISNCAFFAEIHFFHACWYQLFPIVVFLHCSYMSALQCRHADVCIFHFSHVGISQYRWTVVFFDSKSFIKIFPEFSEWQTNQLRNTQKAKAQPSLKVERCY